MPCCPTENPLRKGDVEVCTRDGKGKQRPAGRAQASEGLGLRVPDEGEYLANSFSWSGLRHSTWSFPVPCIYLKISGFQFSLQLTELWSPGRKTGRTRIKERLCLPVMVEAIAVKSRQHEPGEETQWTCHSGQRKCHSLSSTPRTASTTEG